MKNLDPNYGDNTSCDCCGRVFNVRNEPHEIIDDKWWVCGHCDEYYDSEELRDRLQCQGTNK